jgi:hypothetical protein
VGLGPKQGLVAMLDDVEGLKVAAVWRISLKSI